MTILLIILLALNLLSLIFYAMDKWKARRGKWRISETTLLLVAFIGPLGAFLGMRLVRHKTKHWKFRILVPLFLLLWIAAAAAIVYNHYSGGSLPAIPLG